MSQNNFELLDSTWLNVNSRNLNINVKRMKKIIIIIKMSYKWWETKVFFGSKIVFYHITNIITKKALPNTQNQYTNEMRNPRSKQNWKWKKYCMYLYAMKMLPNNTMLLNRPTISNRKMLQNYWVLSISRSREQKKRFFPRSIFISHTHNSWLNINRKLIVQNELLLLQMSE